MRKTRLNKNQQLKLNKGYSIMEMLVTLLVVNILILMLSNILILSLRISLEINARSTAREEMTNITGLIKRDIRNANSVSPSCLNGSSNCIVEKGFETVQWSVCPSLDGSFQQICKFELNPQTLSQSGIKFRSSNTMDYQTLVFQNASVNTGGSNNSPQATILITLTGSHTSENVDIKDLYRQVIVSTLNFNY